MPTLLSIGYELSNLDDFLHCLLDNKVECVIDVRDYPLSRKSGFSKKALSEALQKRGINYEHWRCLGAPKEIRNRLRKEGNWEEYKRAYKQTLIKQTKSLENLAEKASIETLCLLCFERDYHDCHRSLIMNYMQHLDLISKVNHLVVTKKDRLVAHGKIGVK